MPADLFEDDDNVQEDFVSIPVGLDMIAVHATRRRPTMLMFTNSAPREDQRDARMLATVLYDNLDSRTLAILWELLTSQFAPGLLDAMAAERTRKNLGSQLGDTVEVKGGRLRKGAAEQITPKRRRRPTQGGESDPQGA